MGAAKLATVLGAIGLASARVFSGSISGDTNPFIAKFAFGVDPTGGVVGNVQVQYSNLPPSETALAFLGYDDDDWANIYGKVSCANAVPVARLNLPLSPNGSSNTGQITESQRPHFWYFSMANGQYCSDGVYADYTLTLTQADGTQLSFDEIGMPSAYGAFWFFFVVGLGLHVWLHYVRRPRFAPLLVLLLTWSLVLQVLSLTAHMIDWAQTASTGVGVPFFAVVGGLLRIGASMSLWVMAGLAANGFGISTYSLSGKENVRGLALTAAVLMSYLGLIIWYSVDRDPASTSSTGGTWAALILLGVTLAYMGWFVLRIRATIATETHTLKRSVLFRLAVALGCNFVVLPTAEFIAAVTPAYVRLRVATGLDLFMVSLVYVGIGWVLSPRSAGNAFRVYDGSEPAGFLSELADPLATGGGAADFHAALDEAYAYSAMEGKQEGDQPAV